ncbi:MULTISPECIES: Crp/Fnr family transcriptional regulator [Flavobacteriaceae]|uniref:Crp/Fnr family transcriptional regulator n=1 Tax=Flavobacteriaceae TaxID=49546 RepID=UPI00234AAF91|nr:Crp/Fnr family transcriptional regulator [Muricauda sp. SP22]MDC6363823.1 Crp/Fnr family transcriptional regulator [Muricauda sp. SP22]
MDTDYYAPIMKVLTDNTNFTDEQLSKIKDSFKVVELHKKQFLLRPGSKADSLFFVADGCVRVFKIALDREVIIQFGVKGSCVSDLQAYLGKKASEQFIQAIEPSVVLQIRQKQLENLFDEIPPLERFFRIKFENAHSELQERHLTNLSRNARERYEQFRNKFKDLEQRVPQYMIASYLGMTKEFLSYIRRSN